jgi:hypothetical protein
MILGRPPAMGPGGLLIPGTSEFKVSILRGCRPADTLDTSGGYP